MGKVWGIKIGSGDAVFLRTGRWVQRARKGPWNVAASAAGFHASVMPWLKQRDVAARLHRWDFLLTAAAVPVLGGTGFPLNPIATF